LVASRHFAEGVDGAADTPFFEAVARNGRRELAAAVTTRAPG
jgi:hypothetical protein